MTQNCTDEKLGGHNRQVFCVNLRKSAEIFDAKRAWQSVDSVRKTRHFIVPDGIPHGAVSAIGDGIAKAHRRQGC